MRAKMLSARAAVTRTSRRDPRGPMLESLAAEFALLAQRRARMARQIDLLDRQLRAAATGLTAVQSRMAQLSQQMNHLDPALHPAPPPPPPPPRAPEPAPVRRLATLGQHTTQPRGFRKLPFRPH